jgi:hypothetical protein
MKHGDHIFLKPAPVMCKRLKIFENGGDFLLKPNQSKYNLKDSDGGV